MNRELGRFTEKAYDLLVIGGGIYGACVAWDAIVRGLSVALVERGDFGSATSANTLKIIHGGLRYLQHGDIKRMRESIREQRTLMRIAPHLVHPLPVLIPTYGHGTRGKAVLSLALIINEMVGFHCDRGDERENQIPGSQAISKREMKQLIPGIPQRGLTGGVIFYDAQVYNSDRLLLSFLRSAEKAGVDLANYVEVTGFLKEGDCLIGVRVKDVLTEDGFDIRARTVVNASGPWVDRVLGFLNGHVPSRRALLAKAINLVTRPIFQTYAVGVSEKSRYIDRDAVINKGTRFLFITPWRGHSLIGTAYSIYDKDPDHFKVTEEDVQSFLDEINHAWPPANLKRDEISFVHGGLVPISGVDRDTGCIQLARRYEIFDHRHEGVGGLISVIGVKYTTARLVAEKVVDLVFESWGQKPPKSVSSSTPLHGGQIDHFEEFLDAEIRMRPFGLEDGVVRSLVYNYGSAYPEVLRYLDRCDDGDRTATDRLTVLRAEVRHGVREEMAKKLSDVVLRRTELGTVGHPGNEALRICADIMRAELGWTLTKTQQEFREVNEIFTFAH